MAQRPKFIAGNRKIENEDIVLWHTFAHTHVCKPEDMPVMAVEYAGCEERELVFKGHAPTL